MHLLLELTYHYILKNKLIKNNKPKYILIFIFIIISIVIYFFYPIPIINNLLNLFLSIYNWKGWHIPIILKLWHITTLLLVSSLVYIFYNYINNKNILRKKYIIFEGFKWRIEKDIFDRYHIDGLPFCIKHNKQIIYIDKHPKHYQCPDCDLPYSDDSIQEIMYDADTTRLHWSAQYW